MPPVMTSAPTTTTSIDMKPFFDNLNICIHHPFPSLYDSLAPFMIYIQ
jgi:hypothetical protein